MADNTFVNIGGHKVSAGIKYSTTEVKTGDVWIDGKPIYRKVLTHPSEYVAAAGTISNLQIGTISNYDTVISIRGTSKNMGNHLEIPYIVGLGGGSTYLWTFTVWIPSGTGTIYAQIATQTGQTASFTDTIVVVEYTKTTD